MSVRIKRDMNKSYHCAELLERENDFTPDYLQRKLEKYIPVFVYGTLKAGGRFHEILKDAPCFGDAETATKNYTMKATGSDFPVIFSHTKTMAGYHSVSGEVYIVNAAILLELDRIEGNGDMYKREQRWVFLHDQSIKGKGGLLRPAIKAWVYIGVPDFWDGIPLTQMKPKGPPNSQTWDWPIHSSIPKIAQTYPPKPAPEGTPDFLKGTTSQGVASWILEGLDQTSGDKEDIDWSKYDEIMTERAEAPWAN